MTSQLTRARARDVLLPPDGAFLVVSTKTSRFIGYAQKGNRCVRHLEFVRVRDLDTRLTNLCFREWFCHSQLPRSQMPPNFYHGNSARKLQAWSALSFPEPFINSLNWQRLGTRTLAFSWSGWSRVVGSGISLIF